MWPWNHLAFGYLLFSGYVHARHGRSPSDHAVFLLAFATQLPDLVDKPLAWIFGVLPSGVSLAHSLFVAVPLSAAAVMIARKMGNGEFGEAFTIGYVSHLIGDILYPVAIGRGLGFGFLFWPLVPRTGDGPPALLTQVSYLWTRHVEFLSTPRGRTYGLLQVGLFALVVLVWILDGRPGLATIRRLLPGVGRREERDVGRRRRE